jgi:anti-sigma regulatory factor (Ser/Thr protein kinase)
MSQLDNAACAPEAALARYNLPLRKGFRRRLRAWVRLGAGTNRSLQLIAGELVTASLTHAGGTCRLALWRHDGHVVCEARDDGCLDDPLAGRRPYVSDSDRGRGLYVVNAVADLVRAHTTADETTIHAYFG